MREKITRYIRAAYAGLYLVSHEEQRVEAELKAVAAEANDWVAEFEVDLVDSRILGAPVLRLNRLASLV
jgi:hypothetical protein